MKYLVLLCAFLSGCNEAFYQQQREDLLAGFSSSCEAYGFQRGTEQFAQCMMYLDQNYASTQAANSSALTAAGLQLLNNGYRNNQISCQSVQTGIITNTNCF